MNISERIKELRGALALSQDDFGQRLGIKKSAVSKLENGVNSPTESLIKLICSTYHVNYLWLTEWRGEMLEEETPEDMVERLMAGESPLAISIMKAFAALPMEEWRRLRDMIDQVKEGGPR